jgi:hypothetical protein
MVSKDTPLRGQGGTGKGSKHCGNLSCLDAINNLHIELRIHINDDSGLYHD